MNKQKLLLVTKGIGNMIVTNLAKKSPHYLNNSGILDEEKRDKLIGNYNHIIQGFKIENFEYFKNYCNKHEFIYIKISAISNRSKVKIMPIYNINNIELAETDSIRDLRRSYLFTFNTQDFIRETLDPLIPNGLLSASGVAGIKFILGKSSADIKKNDFCLIAHGIDINSNLISPIKPVSGSPAGIGVKIPRDEE
jgi:hypothetical protein